MAIKTTDVKKLATEFNTTALKSIISESDELMRIVLEAGGDISIAEDAAQRSAEAEAALIVRKNDVRELAKRIRGRVEED